MKTYQIKYSREAAISEETGGVTSLLSVRFEFSYSVKQGEKWHEVLKECGYYYSPAHHGYFNPELGLLTYLHEISRDFDDDPQKFREWYNSIQQDSEFKRKLKKVGELVLESIRKVY